jgi:hypothetical protein
VGRWVEATVVKDPADWAIDPGGPIVPVIIDNLPIERPKRINQIERRELSLRGRDRPTGSPAS